MAEHFDINVSGSDGASITAIPLNGVDGKTLGPAGNGKASKSGIYGCDTEPSIGQPGHHGDPAPQVDAASNGGDCADVTITCNEYVGLPLNIRNIGGDGGDGGDAGQGGNGSDGGNAGANKGHCKQFAAGGIGGNSWVGGDAGLGGHGGNAGDIVVVVGPGISQQGPRATTQGGKAGKAGQPGNGGIPGKGGLNSDCTQADPGAAAGPGAYARPAKSGASGSFKQTSDTSKPASYIKIGMYKFKNV